jgi:hypothetical protein
MKHALLTLSFAALVGLAGPADAITLSLDPVSQTASPGDTVMVNIRASNLPGDEVISYYYLMLGYDPTRLTATSVQFGPALGGGDPGSYTETDLAFDPLTLVGTQGPPDDYGNYLGSLDRAVRVYELSFLSDADGDFFSALSAVQSLQPFILVTVTFQLAPGAPAGQTLLELMDDRFYSNPSSGGDFDVKGRTNNVLTSTLIGGSITVRVPVPGTALLMLLAGALGLSRRVVRRGWLADQRGGRMSRSALVSDRLHGSS